MARNWRDIRADAIAQGRLDPARADAARNEMHDAVQAHRLAEIRKAQGHRRQADVAVLMGFRKRECRSWRAATCRTPSLARSSLTWRRWAAASGSSPSLTRRPWS